MKLVFYTDLFIPKRFAGYTVGFIILIRPAYKDDVGLLAHESTHVKQFWRSFGLFGFLYGVSKKYRLKYEAEAYRVQLTYCSEDKINLFAKFLVDNYNLGITIEEALTALKS